jgi:hypothetical protein
MMDFDRVIALFGVIEKNAAHSGKFPFLQAEAFEQLRMLEDEARDAAMKRNTATAFEKTKAEADLKAAQKAAGDGPKPFIHEEPELPLAGRRKI